MTRTKRGKKSVPILFITVIMVLTITVFSGGCVKMLQGSTETVATTDTAPQAMPGSEVTSAVPDLTPVPVPQAPVAEMTPMKSAAVQEVAPVLTPDLYPVLHGTRINDTWVVNPLLQGPYEFEKTYTLKANAAGLLVNVAEGPLYIIYVVTPQNDCLKNPDSCRGDIKKPVNRPYLTITVRDNQTQEIIAEDGYGREYSSDIGSSEYSKTLTSTDPHYTEHSTTTISVDTDPRCIKIYKEGTFHITLEGDFLDVDVKIKTGATPADVGDTSVPGTAPPAEEELLMF